jgi:hypothetical protein
MASIFISYRRSDGGGYAGRIFDRLHREFGSAAVFRDVDAISEGTSFPDAIRHQLETCRVFLLIIGPGWLSARDESGGRRLDDPSDWVRIEIATALKQSSCIIPITVGNARMPAARELPDELKALVERQGRELRDGDTWNGDMELLVRRISTELGVQRGKLVRIALLSASALALVGGLSLWGPRFFAARPPLTRASFSSEPIVIFENTNTEPVKNQPSTPTIFEIKQTHFVTHIFTYHWNNGRGSPPGRVSLRLADGKVFGPWEVRGTSGQDGRQNVNWLVEPNIVIPAGKYTVHDSEPKTWSQNSQSGNAGFAIIKGHAIND